MSSEAQPQGRVDSHSVFGTNAPALKSALGPKPSIVGVLKSSLDGLARSRTPIGGLAKHLKSYARAPYRYRWLYLTDVLLTGIAMALALVFRFGLQTLGKTGIEYQQMTTAVPLYMLICAVVFPLTGLYMRNWRYVSIGDLKVIVWAVALASVIFVSVMFAFTRLAMIPRSVIAIEFLILVPLLAAVRMRFRLHELNFNAVGSLKRQSESIPVLLIGAGKEADTYLRVQQGDPSARYVTVGLLDEAADQQGIKIRNVPILGTLKDFNNVVEQLAQRNKRPRHVIFTNALSKYAGNAAELVVAKADELGIAVSRLSSPNELRNARTDGSYEVQSIELTDLLERPQTALERTVVSKMIKGRRVLVTGAGGSIGSELCLQVAALQPAEITLVENSEFNLYSIDLDLAEKFPEVKRRAHLCNIRDSDKVNQLFDEMRPELVFHAAALKHVPLVELNPAEGFLTNVIGTRNVADAANRSGVIAMVQVSTDKVVNPTSAMGLTKRLAELYCQALDLSMATEKGSSRFMTVRFGNVLGSSGSLIPLFQRQIAKGGPLTVTDANMKRFFMTIREAVELTLQASSQGVQKELGRGEIFVLDMGEQIKIIDIARRMIRLAGYVPDQDISIQIVGCRPGEKLYEELFDKYEQRVPSSVTGVFGALPSPISLERLNSSFDALKIAASTGNTEAAFKIAKELVPGYTGNRGSASRDVPAFDTIDHQKGMLLQEAMVKH